MLDYWKIVRSIPSQVYMGGVIVALVVSMSVMTRTYQRKAMEGQFLLDSVMAVNDTMRVSYALDRVRFERRIVQTEMKNDSINKRLKTESAVRLTLQYFVDSVYGVADHVDMDDIEGDTLPDVLNVTFSGYTPPFRVSGVTTLDFVEDTAGTTYKVSMDPFGINMRIECGKTAVNGVRPALALIETPKFVRVTMDTLRQDPDVCSPPPSIPIVASKQANKLWLVVGFGVGAYAGSRLSKFLKRK